MAWVNGKWLDRKERAGLIAELTQYKSKQMAKLATLDGDELIELEAVDMELERLERIHRCEVDTLAFDIEYFSEAKNEGNAGNWDGFNVTSTDEAPDFHVEITDILNVVSTDKVNAKIAVAAPRSHAKSTYLTKGFPLHQVVYRKRKYIIIISETPSVSGPNLEWLATQLKHNEKLRNDFGPLLSPRQQENDRDNSTEFIAWEPKPDGGKRQLTKVEAASTGQALRGRNWQGARPDLIVCDDLEDAKTNAATAEQRAKLRDWFSSVVMPLGDPKGAKTAIVYMGTTVHFDALLMQILYKRSDFETRVYRAIIDPPKRSDLWEQCREIYINRENPKRSEDARQFYENNIEAMNEGVRVLWPEFQPIYKLMTWKWDNGSKAFNTEYQNNPIDEENMIFNPANFTYWDTVTPDRKFDSKRYTISMGVDFAMGKKERGDFSAVTVVAKEKETGYIYVADSFVERLHPDEFIKVIVRMVSQWQPDVIGAEATAAQEYFVDTLKGHLDVIGYPAHTRVKKIYNRSRKELRIEAMMPSIENKTIRFNSRHLMLLEQFERYGQGAHDDAVDSMEISINSLKYAKREIHEKPAWL